MNVETARKILGDKAVGLSDEKIKDIIDRMYRLSRLIISQLENQANQIVQDANTNPKDVSRQ